MKGENTSVENAKLSYALFGAGCFWGVEDYFGRVKGVVRTEVGYAGGHTQNPTYDKVSSNTTGHVEVVRIQFNEATIQYKDLINHFFKIHDPTTPDRQGADIGSQYRSVIFYYDDKQGQIARSKIKEIEEKEMYEKPIITEVLPFKSFYRAEEYHQQYTRRTGLGGCHI